MFERLNEIKEILIAAHVILLAIVLYLVMLCSQFLSDGSFDFWSQGIMAKLLIAVVGTCFGCLPIYLLSTVKRFWWGLLWAGLFCFGVIGIGTSMSSGIPSNASSRTFGLFEFQILTWVVPIGLVLVTVLFRLGNGPVRLSPSSPQKNNQPDRDEDNLKKGQHTPKPCLQSPEVDGNLFFTNYLLSDVSATC